MATQQEAAAALLEIKNKLAKVATETTTLLQKIEDLKNAAANAGNVGPELQSAIDAVAAQASAVDELVPDATPEPAPNP